MSIKLKTILKAIICVVVFVILWCIAAALGFGVSWIFEKLKDDVIFPEIELDFI